MLMCNAKNSVYSWGALGSTATGYFGSDVTLFMGAVGGSAPGIYDLQVVGDLSVKTDMTIHGKQFVRIASKSVGPCVLAPGVSKAYVAVCDSASTAAACHRLDATCTWGSGPSTPAWGSGNFALQADGSLAVANLHVSTVIEMSEGASGLTLDSCVLSFRDTIVLRTVTTRFINMLDFAGGVAVSAGTQLVITNATVNFLTAGLVVQSGAVTTIAGSTFSFAAAVNTGIGVQQDGSATATGSTFQAAVNSTIAVTVAEGGQFSVGDSHLVTADGTTNPFPCDGTMTIAPPATATCATPHFGLVQLSVPTVWFAIPLVCDVTNGQCSSDLCDVVNCGEHGTCNSPRGTCTCQGPHGMVDGHRYVAPWTGNRCAIPPNSAECCSTNDMCTRCPFKCGGPEARGVNGCPNNSCSQCDGVSCRSCNCDAYC